MSAPPADSSAFEDQMALGVAWHESGDRARALSAFEAAMALSPQDARAASACATLLFELARPRAALACLLTVENQLLADTEGAANLAFAAAACGDTAGAERYFSSALARDPAHVRALSHLGLIRAQQGRWDDAIALARTCLQHAPAQDWAWAALADLLTGAQRHADALKQLEEALQHFPGHAALTLRQAVLLALAGAFDRSDQLLQSLALTGSLSAEQLAAGDAREIFGRHAFEALQACDWQHQARWRDLIRADLAALNASAPSRDMRPALVAGPLLPLSDAEMRLANHATWQAVAAPSARPDRPFYGTYAVNRQGAIRIGIAALNLRDEAATAELAAWLSAHDSARFDFYVYSPTPQPQAVLAQALAPHRVIEIAHFNDDDAVARIRLDRLDIWLDLTFGAAEWRPAISARRVAPVQLQHPSSPGQPHSPLDYVLTDGFIHPQTGANRAGPTELIRLPHTCWPALPARSGSALPALTRDEAGLPADALVLCVFAPALQIDAHSFSLWMHLLLELPGAVAWLPPLSAGAQAHLRREAEAAGVSAQRLYFSAATTRQQRLAGLALADLFLDTLRINSRQDLRDALAMGVPAISCAGSHMAARTGGSMLHAAGLGDCVLDNEAAYVEAVLRLGRDRQLRQALRARLQASLGHAALFDLPARVRELEAAWTHMAGRARAGLPPASADLPSV